jgi:beta-glucosidase
VTPPKLSTSFLWGAATSAYQIEGSPLADGAGPSIWHRFVHTPGRTVDGSTGDTACDHYRRADEDVALMADLGLQAYRFSVAWGRVLPMGTGCPSNAGLAFYDRLVDRLLEHGIEPFITLYHWDLPAALDDRGGWLNRDVAAWFGEYAALLARRLGDRVRRWATLNEPWVSMHAGYITGNHAPGHRNHFEGPLTAHNLLRAHGAGVAALRAEGAQEVGLVVNLEPKVPASNDPADHAAAVRADAYMNRLFLDPVLLGAYPEASLREIFGPAWPAFPASDFDTIRTPLDFVGINYYTRNIVRAAPGRYPDGAEPVKQPDHPYTEMGWEVYAPALEDLLVGLGERYGPTPLYVAENGAAFYDPPTPIDGRVDDPLRVHYLREHVAALARAVARGADVRGYFAWSLLDNFEWGYGYTKRFGLVHVDFATQRRTLKASAHIYRDIIASRGAAAWTGA